jgi:hypothetical protein
LSSFEICKQEFALFVPFLPPRNSLLSVVGTRHLDKSWFSNALYH